MKLSIKKIIIVIVCIFVILGIIFLYSLLVPKTVNTPPVVVQATPTPFVLPPLPTRNPNVLPEQFLESEREFIKKTPILQRLPPGSQFFSVEYIDEQHLIVHSKTADKQRDYQEAQKWFAENKIDTTKIIIEYQ